MKRRNFFESLFAFVPFGLSFLGMTAISARFLSPSRKERKLRKIYATSLRTMKVNESMPFTDLSGKELLLVRTSETEVKALSTVCTHLGCKVHWEKDKGHFLCPCHNGIFDPNGVVTAGPPPKDLDTYPVEIIGENVYIYLKEKEV